jgi:hypothetical protein
MRRFLVPLVLAVASQAYGFAADPQIPELQPLEAIVGNWEGSFAVNNSPKETKYSISAEWTLGGRYVLSRNSITGDNSKSETMILWTYDTEQKLYRRWFFFSTGGTFQEWGTWDANTKTFTFRGSDFTGPEGQPVPFPDRSRPTPGARTESTVEVTGADSKKWTMRITNPEGGVITVLGTNQRAK